MPKTELVPLDERSVTYTPLAEADEITISVGMARNVIAVPTRSGATPTDRDLMNFVMLCKSRRLNPFTGDAYLVGYDSKDGPTFSLITSVAALRKRAEAHPQFDGCLRGLVIDRDGEIEDIDRQCYFGPGTVVGGWAEVVRKDHAAPYREYVRLSVYDTGRSRWRADPEGMICKVAESAALRRAFPSELAGMYLAEEFGDSAADVKPQEAASRYRAGKRSEITELLSKQTPVAAAAEEAKPAEGKDSDPPPADGGPSEDDLRRAGISQGQLFGTTPDAF